MADSRHLRQAVTAQGTATICYLIGRFLRYYCPSDSQVLDKSLARIATEIKTL